MEKNLYVLGDEQDLIYYNLNNNFCNIKKILISSKFLLNSFETDKIKDSIFSLKNLNFKDFENEIVDFFKSDILEDVFKNQFYKEIQEQLKNISSTEMDIKLKDYNFMSSVSNAKYTICIRTSTFSISEYYHEKASILSSIRILLKKYLSFSGNKFRVNKLDKFQIEIYETEEMYKSVYLKKDSNKLLLSSSFGFFYNQVFDFSLGSEFYFSLGEDFNFFKNSQQFAMIREHGKILKKEINPQEKILTNDDLISINNQTKNINDALVELYINIKGKIKIVNLSLLENSLCKTSEDLLILNKSSKNYNKISLISLRDDLDEEYPNPKYLLLKNENEIVEIVENLEILKKIDGLIFLSNFYSPLFDFIAEELDIDIIYYKNILEKSLEVNIDFVQLKIEGAPKQNKENPFSSILGSQKAEKDAFLEKLKNIDLSSPKREQSVQNRGEISDIAKNIISSPESSKFNSNSGINWGSNNNNNSKGVKKSAIAMLAESVLNPPKLNEKEEEFENQEHQTNLNKNFNFHDEEEKNENLNTFSKNSSFSSFVEVKSRNGEDINPDFSKNFNSFHNSDLETESEEKDKFGSHFNIFDSKKENFQNQNTDFQNSNSNFQNQAFGFQNNQILDNQKKNLFDEKILEKYENIISTKIITPPFVKSQYHFADLNSIHLVEGGEIFFMTTDIDNLKNSNLKYIIPISLKSQVEKEVYYLINNSQEFFMIEDKMKDYFINISQIPLEQRKNVIKISSLVLNSFSLIIEKKDINLVEDFISQIKNIYIKDLSNIEEFNSFEKKILEFEKRQLMKL